MKSRRANLTASNMFDIPPRRRVKDVLHACRPEPQLTGAASMPQYERFAWGSLLASVLSWLFLTMRMTEDWMVVDLMIVAHAVLGGLLHVRGEGRAEKDERDLAIAARAERIEGLVVVLAVNVLIIHALAQAAFAGHALPSIDLGALPVLFYALLSVLFLGHTIGQFVTIWQYRA